MSSVKQKRIVLVSDKSSEREAFNKFEDYEIFLKINKTNKELNILREQYIKHGHICILFSFHPTPHPPFRNLVGEFSPTRKKPSSFKTRI